MVNTYIDFRLCRWAEWVLRRVDHGVGYPRQCCYTNLMPRTGFSTNAPEFEQDAFDIEKCVEAVKVVNVQLHLVIELTYLRTMTIEQKLKHCGCCEKTFYNRLDRAQQLILGYLNDLAADVPIPTQSISLAHAA